VASGHFGRLDVWSPGGTHREGFDYDGQIVELAWSPNGHWLAGGSEGAVHLWRFDERDELHMHGFRNKVRALAWERGSRYLATGGAAPIAVWDFEGKGPAGSEPRDRLQRFE
jgi:WD40 repeat protein